YGGASASNGVMTGAASESASAHISPVAGDLFDGFGVGGGNIDDAFVGRGGPLTAVVVLRLGRVVVIVRQGIPGMERRMVIANAGNEVIVGENIGGRDRRVGRNAPGEHAAEQHEADAFAPFHDSLKPNRGHLGTGLAPTTQPPQPS